MGNATNAVPNPGSDEAAMRGCTCARMDNSYGKGYLGRPGMFFITEGCPLHAPLPARRQSSEGGR